MKAWIGAPRARACDSSSSTSAAAPSPSTRPPRRLSKGLQLAAGSSASAGESVRSACQAASMRRRQQRFGAARDHRVGAPATDRVHRLADRHRRGRAGGGEIGERAAQAPLHRDVRAGGVVHRHHHGERPQPEIVLAVDGLVGAFERVRAAHAGAPVDADAVAVRRGRIEAARGERLAAAASANCATRSSAAGLGPLEMGGRDPSRRARRPGRRSRASLPRAGAARREPRSASER